MRKNEMKLGCKWHRLITLTSRPQELLPRSPPLPSSLEALDGVPQMHPPGSFKIGSCYQAL